MNIDFNSLIAPVITFLLGIGVVGGFVVKYIGKAKKAIGIAKEGLDLVNTVIESLEVKAGETKSELTADEITAIRKEYDELMKAIGKK